MRNELTYVTTLLAVGAAAAAIACAPIAGAAPASTQPTASASSASSDPSPGQQCTTLGGTQSVCQSPGNAQVNDAPPQVDFYPYAGGAT
jgi:hypothetical protein